MRVRALCLCLRVWWLQELFDRYRGADADAPEQRKAVARFVGLEMPAVPAGEGSGKARDAEGVASAYAAPLASAGAGEGGGLEGLSGLDYVKAQLYGVEAVVGRPVSKAMGSGGGKPAGQ